MENIYINNDCICAYVPGSPGFCFQQGGQFEQEGQSIAELTYDRHVPESSKQLDATSCPQVVSMNVSGNDHRSKNINLYTISEVLFDVFNILCATKKFVLY